MIIINDKKYDKYETKVTQGSFVACKYVDGKKIESHGKAPYIKFNIKDEILICIEMNYSYEMFETLRIGDDTDITNNITDINFEDKSGWITFSDRKCSVTRINNEEFEFLIIVDDKLEEFNMHISSIVKIF